jgi:hypothetical protein
MLGSFIAGNSVGLEPPQAAGIHPYIAVKTSDGYNQRPMQSYNALVDLMGEKNLGGKTLIYLVDGLFAAPRQGAVLDYRYKWKSAPFNGNWTSSLFASFDNVAIESVCLDFLRAEQEASEEMTEVSGNVDNYLHEAALADSPPSGVFYHPNGSTELESLGVHEHWNNAQDKLYTRNLGTGNGIELVTLARPWNPTSTGNLTVSESIVVFPNPASDAISIKSSNPCKGKGKLELYNLSGKLLYMEQINKDDYEFFREINISEFKGTLILKISMENYTCSKIIIRQ